MVALLLLTIPLIPCVPSVRAHHTAGGVRRTRYPQDSFAMPCHRDVHPLSQHHFFFIGRCHRFTGNLSSHLMRVYRVKIPERPQKKSIKRMK